MGLRCSKFVSEYSLLVRWGGGWGCWAQLSVEGRGGNKKREILTRSGWGGGDLDNLLKTTKVAITD